MKCLAIETAGFAGSVALDNQGEINQVSFEKPRQQTQAILPAIDELLNKQHCRLNDLDAIALSIGPGSFTGLRVGVSVVQSIAWAQQLPVIPISTLRIMAQTAYRSYGGSRFIVGLNAYMHEFYCGRYQLDEQTGIVNALAKDVLLRPDWLYEKLGDDKLDWLVGDAWQVYSKQWQSGWACRLDRAINVMPQAYDLLTIAKAAYTVEQRCSAEQVTPVYLRDSSAWRTASDH